MTRRPRKYASRVEAMWLGAESRAWAIAKPKGHFPTALTYEEADEAATDNGGVLALYTHPETTFRWLDPFRICEHSVFRKQVYPDLKLSDGCPLGAKIPNRHRELREPPPGRSSYDPGQIRVTWGGVELQGFVDGSFVETSPVQNTYVPVYPAYDIAAPLNAFQQSVGPYATADATNAIELDNALRGGVSPGHGVSPGRRGGTGSITMTLVASAYNTDALDAIAAAIDEGTKPVSMGHEWTFDPSDLPDAG